MFYARFQLYTSSKNWTRKLGTLYLSPKPWLLKELLLAISCCSSCSYLLPCLPTNNKCLNPAQNWASVRCKVPRNTSLRPDTALPPILKMVSYNTPLKLNFLPSSSSHLCLPYSKTSTLLWDTLWVHASIR